MKYFGLLMASLFRKKTLTILTLLSICTGFVLFGFLDGVRTAFTQGGGTIGLNRLVVASRLSITQPLPLSQLAQIKRVPGVREIAHGNWFGGIYQDRRNFFLNIAISPTEYLAPSPELELSKPEYDAFLSTRTGAREDTVLIAPGPGIQLDHTGLPLASAEVVVVSDIPKKTTATDANVEVRGVGSQGWALRPNVTITAGRRFTPGLRKLVVGRGAHRQLSGLGLGARIKLGNQPWTVAGIFAANDAHDSELWGDSEVVRTAYRRSAVQSVTVKLTSAAAFDAFKTALTADPRLNVEVQRTRDYYAAQSERLKRPIDFLALTVGTIMAVGAAFGALNTMHAAVSARAREIAISRALGFAGTPVVISVLLESLLLAGIGGVLGAAIAWALFDSYTVSTLGANFSQGVFAFKVSLPLALNALEWAVAIGFVGGLLPALSAARMPLTSALRAL